MSGRSGAYRRPSGDAWRMHEWPLVVFTALAIPAAGLSTARVLVDSLGLLRGHADDTVTEAWIALLVGLAVSLAHLGRVERAHLALKRFGRNALSTEVGLAVALLFVAGTALVPGIPLSLSVFLVRASGVLGAALLGALGLVYYLAARRPWHSPLVATPLTSGLSTGLIILAWEDPSPATTALAFLLLAVDTAVYLPAWASDSLPAGFAPVHAALFPFRTPLVLLRFAVFDLVPAVTIVRSPGLAVLAVLVGLLVDRLAFYGLAVGRTTEAEIARVEAMIFAGAQAAPDSSSIRPR